MANYESGVQTKTRILKACKKLFFEKGFDETTYDDICPEANVNRALIPYHFGSKDNLGKLVFSNFIIDNNKLVDSLLNEKAPNLSGQYNPALHQLNYQRLIMGNENLWRFYSQVSRKMYPSPLENLSDIYDNKNAEAFGLEISDIDRKYRGTAVMGMAASTTIGYMSGYLDATIEEHMDYRVRLFYILMGMDVERADEIIRESKIILSNFHVGVKNYFIPYVIK